MSNLLAIGLLEVGFSRFSESQSGSKRHSIPVSNPSIVFILTDKVSLDYR